MMKILLITTGGTIAAVPTSEGLAPDAHGGALPAVLDMLGGCHEIRHIPLFSIDSANMQPEEWREIARCVYENAAGHDGVVITHGTDTMAYTASALSFMLEGLPVPVVLTTCLTPAASVMVATAVGTSGSPHWICSALSV